MRTPVVVFALLLIPSALLAQSPANNVIIFQAPLNQNCPVGIEASHSSRGAMEQIDNGGRPHQLSYNIALSSLNLQRISQASITLRGLSGPQLMLASAHAIGDATETFTITPGDSPKASFHSVVYTGKLTGVRWVEVNEVTYADGKQWHQTGGSVCRVAPNGFLPVASN
jgi:hypothetical protein